MALTRPQYLDAMRQMGNSFKYNIRDHMDNIYEYRYELRNDNYRLKRWNNGTETSSQGTTAAQPEWLTAIVAVAKVSGYLKEPISPPPSAILWFHTDQDHNLIDFIQIGNP